MKLGKIGWLIGIVALAAVFGAETARASEVIGLLFENGVPPMVIQPDGSLSGKLFCEGDVECGTIAFTDMVPIEFSADKFNFEATVNLCRGGDCLVVHHARYLGDALPEMPVVVPGAVLFQFSMVDHDPIACSDATGKFAGPACSGQVKLDYRCLAEVDLSIPTFVAARASAYVISQIK